MRSRDRHLPGPRRFARHSRSATTAKRSGNSPRLWAWLGQGAKRISPPALPRPSAKGMAAIREVLVGGDFYPSEEREHTWQQEIGPIRAFAWPLLVQAAGLASIAGSRLALTAAGRRALVRAPHRAQRVLSRPR